MKRCSNILALVILCALSTTGFAATTERVIAVLPDGVIELQATGKARLANLGFPEMPRAEAWLSAQALQQPLTFEKSEVDRYGRTVVTSDREEKMLRDGVALVYATDGEIPANWLAAEAMARHAKSGIWADDHLIVTPENAAQHENEFHVVEGVVRRVYANKTATYLNFGADWHSDFSITIPAKLRRGMQDQLDGITQGSQIRVRGRLYEENGPMILLTHAANLERF